MTIFIIYIIGIITMMIAFAIRTQVDTWSTLLLSTFWPLSLFLLMVIKFLWTIDCDMDIVTGEKWFGYRKPDNPKLDGFAVTIVKLEFQFWSKKLKE